MHPSQLTRRAIELHAAGMTVTEVSRELHLPRGTVSHWLIGNRVSRTAERLIAPTRCPRCSDPPRLPEDARAYVHLLGLYLGDGHLVTSVRVPVLRIYCTATWPVLIDECEASMRRVLATSVQRVGNAGCVAVQSYSMHWPCLLPQHGPGLKHMRKIALSAWQQAVVDEFPGDFLRGLFHSDGCRSDNRVIRNGKTYHYPRYMFSNESADIMGLCQQSLDRLGVSWRMCRRNMLSVARGEGVAVLDRWVGAKA